MPSPEIVVREISGQTQEAVEQVFSEPMEELSRSVRAEELINRSSELVGNVTCHGDLVNAVLSVSGNLTVHGEIRSSTIVCLGHFRSDSLCANSSIYARGNVSTHIVRHCDVFSEESVLIGREVRSSILQAAGSILGLQACCYASVLAAFESLNIGKVCESEESSTELSLGDLFLRRRKAAVLHQRMIMTERDYAIKHEVAVVHRKAREHEENASQCTATMLRIERELEQKKEAAEIARKHYESFQEDSLNGHGGCIVVERTIAAGTLIKIGEQSLQMALSGDNLSFHSDGSSLISVNSR